MIVTTPEKHYEVFERELPNHEKIILRMDSETGQTWELIEKDGQRCWTPIAELQN